MAVGFYEVPRWAETYDYVVGKIQGAAWASESVLPLDGLPSEASAFLYRAALERRELFLTFDRLCCVLDGSPCEGTESAALEWQAAACLRHSKNFRQRSFLFATWFVSFARQRGYLYLDGPLNAFRLFVEHDRTAQRCTFENSAMASTVARLRMDAKTLSLWASVLVNVDNARDRHLGPLGRESETRCALHRENCTAWDPDTWYK